MLVSIKGDDALNSATFAKNEFKKMIKPHVLERLTKN